MCDFFVALGNSTASGSVLLAKSADTEINEAEHVVRLPRRAYPEGALWWKHERLHRRAMADYAALKPEIRADFDALEEEFFAEAPPVKKATASLKSAFMAECWRRAEEITEAWIKKLERRNYFIQNERYREMWDRFNQEAAFPI